MPIKAGDELGTGVGERAADTDLRVCLRRACNAHSAPRVTKTLCIEDPDIWEFCEWFRGVEQRAAADTENPSMGAGERRGGGDGVMLSESQRHVMEIPLLLKRLMEDPTWLLEALDGCR